MTDCSSRSISVLSLLNAVVFISSDVLWHERQLPSGSFSDLSTSSSNGDVHKVAASLDG